MKKQYRNEGIMKEIILEKAIGKLDTGKEMDERIMKNVEQVIELIENN